MAAAPAASSPIPPNPSTISSREACVGSASSMPTQAVSSSKATTLGLVNW